MGGGGKPMVTTARFGKKLKLPSTVQLKHQLLLRWLADQTLKEETEAKAATRTERRTRRPM
jgi:hypothetical protein